MFFWISGGAGISLICEATVHKISDGPIFAAAIKHLNNSKGIRFGIDSIELSTELVILASVVTPTKLTRSFVLWTTLSVLVTGLHLSVGSTRAQKSFSRSLICYGIILSTTIFSECTLKFYSRLVQVPTIELTLTHDCSRNALKRFKN